MRAFCIALSVASVGCSLEFDKAAPNSAMTPFTVIHQSGACALVNDSYIYEFEMDEIGMPEFGFLRSRVSPDGTVEFSSEGTLLRQSLTEYEDGRFELYQFDYDQNDRLVTLVGNGQGLRSFRVDYFDDTVAKRTYADGSAVDIQIKYDKADGRLLRWSETHRPTPLMHDKWRQVWTYDYDADGRIRTETITYPDGPNEELEFVTKFGYDCPQE